jgi:tonB-dependent receptor domain protein
MNKKLFSIVFLGTLATFSAQEKQIDEVLVQGKFFETPYQKVNENIVVIQHKEIEQSPAKSIDELLQQYTGVDIRKRGGNGVLSDISIRGGSYDQVLILVNGVRMNDSQTGHNSFNIPIDLSNVEQIEIVKGPAARRFGNNAYAGVINIITKSHKEKTVKITAEGGDFEAYSLGANINLGGEKFSQSLQANTAYSTGYRYNTDYQIRNVFYQNQLDIKNGKVGIQAGFSEKKFGSNGFYGSSADQYEEIQASIVSMAYRQKLGNWGLNANAYWRRGQDMYLWKRQNPAAYRNMHIGNNVGGQLNASYDSKIGTTGLGVELRKEFLASNNLGHRNRFLTQVFFEHHFSFFSEKLQIVPGISWANYDKAGNFFYPGVDVGFNFNENNKIYANVAKVNRIPTFTELYYSNRENIGNADLKPESAISSEVGYRYQNPKITAKVSGFMRNSSDAIDWVRNTSAEKWAAKNVGDMNLKGVEVEFSHRPVDWFSYSAGYTFIDNKRETEGYALSKYALENLKHQLVGKVEARFLKYFSNQLIYRYNQRLDFLSYHLLDYKISFKRNGLDIYGLINNVTNTQYGEVALVPLPKRWFHVGISYTIKMN